MDRLYEFNLIVLHPGMFILVSGSAALGIWSGRRFQRSEATDLGTLTGAALGLLAPLLAFSFSLALSRHDARRNLVLAEANAIGTAANFALMLPAPFQARTLGLLRDYAAVRVGLGIPFAPAKFDQDIARSVDLQTKLWQQAVAATTAAPQALPTYRFVAALNEMNNIHESRVTALRYHVPGAVMLMLIAVTMIAIGLAGYQVGVSGFRSHTPLILMSLTVAGVIVMVFDLDQPARGFIQIPVQALIDEEHGIPQ